MCSRSHPNPSPLPPASSQQPPARSASPYSVALLRSLPHFFSFFNELWACRETTNSRTVINKTHQEGECYRQKPGAGSPGKKITSDGFKHLQQVLLQWSLDAADAQEVVKQRELQKHVKALPHLTQIRFFYFHSQIWKAKVLRIVLDDSGVTGTRGAKEGIYQSGLLVFLKLNEKRPMKRQTRPPPPPFFKQRLFLFIRSGFWLLLFLPSFVENEASQAQRTTQRKDISKRSQNLRFIGKVMKLNSEWRMLYTLLYTFQVKINLFTLVANLQDDCESSTSILKIITKHKFILKNTFQLLK